MSGTRLHLLRTEKLLQQMRHAMLNVHLGVLNVWIQEIEVENRVSQKKKLFWRKYPKFIPLGSEGGNRQGPYDLVLKQANRGQQHNWRSQGVWRRLSVLNIFGKVVDLEMSCSGSAKKWQIHEEVRKMIQLTQKLKLRQEKYIETRTEKGADSEQLSIKYMDISIWA